MRDPSPPQRRGGGKELWCGGADLKRPPRSFVRRPAGASGALRPRGPFLIFEEGAGCLLPCPARGETAGKERRRVKGAISSFSRGLHKAGSTRCAFRRVNADEVAPRMVKSKVNFLSENQSPAPASGEALPRGELVQAVKDASTGLSDWTRARRWKHPDAERKGYRFFGIAYFWSAPIWRDDGLLSL